jgi:peptidoglycan/LPS O-acetylase OafA/YrhL
VVFHAFPLVLPSGFLGVDVFFVISGFLITGIVSTDLVAGRFGFVQFYDRRIRRIIPALLVVLAATLALGWFLMLPTEFEKLGEQVIGGALFFANIQYLLESGYFDKAATLKPLLHLWSLSVEEQFYIIWPLLLWATAKRIGWLGLTASIAVLSFIADVVVAHHDASAAFYLPFTRFWELMLGAGIALAYAPLSSAFATFHRRQPRLYLVSVLASGALVIVPMFVATANGEVTVWWSLLPTVGTALIIVLGSNGELSRSLLAAPGMVQLGKISYPLYLWHWPLLSFLQIASLGEASVWWRAGAIVLSIVLAWLTYSAIERPVRFGSLRYRASPFLCAGLVALSASGYVVFRSSGFPTRIPAPLRQYVMVKYDWTAGARSKTCWLSATAPWDGFAPTCFRKSRPPGASLLVWGDSHAARLYVGISKVYGNKLNVEQLTRDSCAPLLNVGGDATCNESNDYVLSLISKDPPSLVLMFAAWNLHAIDFRAGPQAAELIETVSQLRAAGVRHILVVGPAPQWTAALPNLLARQWLSRRSGEIPRIMKYGLAEAPFKVDAELKSVIPRPARFVSLVDEMCDASGCITRTGNEPDDLVTADYGHLTAAGAEFVARLLPIERLLHS